MNGQGDNRTISERLHSVWEGFQRRTNLVKAVTLCDKFLNGEQWPENNIYNWVRVTDNKIADGIRKIASKIVGTPIYYAFTADDPRIDCALVRRYDEFVLSKIGYKAFSLQSVINAESRSTEITYWSFDPNSPWDSGGLYDGGIRCDHISMLNFAVENPHEPNVQRQEWVMFWVDEYVGKLAKILKEDKYLSKKEYKERRESLYSEAQTRSPNPDSQNKDMDILNNARVRVYVRFFRIDNEVFYTLETTNTYIYKYPKPMSRYLDDAIAKELQDKYDKLAADGFVEQDDDDDRQFRLVKDLDIDFEDTVINFSHKEVDEEDRRQYREKFSLYPFATFVPVVIDDFFFGRSKVREMISSQKAINYAVSLQVKALENMALGKVYVRDGAMKSGETYSSNPEDNIQADHYKGNGNGFYTINPPSMPAELMSIPQFLTEEMKNTYGFSDFANGELRNQEASGYAIQQMLKQANSPLEQEQLLYWKYQEDCARIRLMFYKHYVNERKFSFEYSDMEYQEEEQARKLLLSSYLPRNGQPGVGIENGQGNKVPFDQFYEKFGKPTPKRRLAKFDGRSLWGVDFDIKIDAQQGVVGSELATSQWWTSTFANGGMEAFANNPDMLIFAIQSAPKPNVPDEYRATMLRYAESMRQSVIRKLQTQNQMLAQQLEQAISMGKAQQDQYLMSLGAANSMVKNAQAENKASRQKLQQVMGEGEIKSNNAKGMNTQDQLAQVAGQDQSSKGI